MRDNKRTSKKIWAAILLTLVLAGAGPVGAMQVQAFANEQTSVTVIDSVGDSSAETESEEKKKSDFDIRAELLASDGDTYNIRLNVKNGGADWEGTVRMSVDEEYRVPSVYDTALSLAQGSEKQFVVKIPKGASDSSDGSLRVVLLDKKSNPVEDKSFKKFLTDEMESLSMGILSDDYSSLTYLDMGGNTLYYYGGNLAVQLVELSQDNLTDLLDSLTILVIDKYNTGVLTDEETKALSLWIDKGGVLIVGTGSYAEDTLEGLGDILPDVKLNGIVEAGVDKGSMNLNGADSLDVSQLALASIQVTGNQYYESYYTSGLTISQGDGAASILPYSLVELGKADSSIYIDAKQETYVLNMLEDISSSSNARYSRNSNIMNVYEKMSLIRRMMGIVGNSNNVLHFGLLKFLVILYVIFVGPVLYLILRMTKKREWYWAMVPVTAFIGIIIVFVAGRGFEVVNTRVYSVTTKDLLSSQGAKTYLYCYDAEFKEWSLQLGEGYDYVGPLTNENYNYNSDEDILKYYHRVQNEGEALSFGIKPSSAFEDSYFYAGKSKDSDSSVGDIAINNVGADWTGIQGEISNETDKDFRYFAVIVNDTLYVYENLPAGSTCSLNNALPVYNSSSGYNLRNDYIYNFIRDINEGDIKGDAAAAAALGAGICDVYYQGNVDAVVVCGVTEDWDKTVDDNCNEVSYGCLYKVQ